MSTPNAAVSAEASRDMNAPTLLRNQNQWLVWKYETYPGDQKPRKVPYYINGQRRKGVQGSDEDRSSLASLDSARQVMSRDRYDGLGFAFLPGDGLIGIDLDNVIDADTGEISERATNIIKACSSYTEYSPSRRGVHIFVAGETETFKSNAIGVEVFCGRQFFTFTGDRYGGTPLEVTPIAPEVLNRLRLTVRGPTSTPQPRTYPVPRTRSQGEELDRVESALAYVSSDEYRVWMERVPHALKHEFGDAAFHVWDRWSAKSAKYPGSEECRRRWETVKPAGRVTLGTIYALAKEGGWTPPRSHYQAANEGARLAAPKEQQDIESMNNNLADVEVWPEPKPLQRKPSDPTPFPINALGGVLGDAAKAMAEVIQAPLAICGNSVLAAAALAAQGHANFLIDGRRHPLSEFFITIGMTGERKSAVDSIALLPHRERQRQLMSSYTEKRTAYDRDADAFKKARDEAISQTKSKTYDAKRRALAELGEAPQEPIEPFLICEEPTYEGLVKMLENGQPSIGLFSDEGGRLIGGHSMNSENLLKTAAGMSGLWDGREISRVRAGDGAKLLHGRRVSLHLMAQPDIAAILLSNAVLLEQGLLSRCLVTWPTSTAGTRYYKEVDLSERAEIRAYSAAMLKLLELDVALKEETRNELAPRDLPLHHDAKQLWIEFHNAIESQLVEGGQLAHIRGLANKAPEHAGRLAGILSLVENVACASISDKWMAAGIKLVTHYLNEATRLYEAGASDPDIRDAEKLIDWLHSRAHDKRTVVSLVETYQYGPNGIRNAKRARELMKILEEHGYVLPTLDPDNRRKEVWRVRP